jgi:hypothetical protein
MNPLPISHSATSHPRPRRQGPLDNTWRSLHHHRRRRPPSPSLSATATIVVIMELVVAWCRLPPLSSSSLSYTTTATLLTTDQRRLTLVLLPPPRHRIAFSALLITHGAILDRHAASTPSGTMRRLPLPPAPPLSKDGTIAPAPPSRPPRCLGLLSGGWRWIILRFSGRRRRSGNGDGSTLTLPLVPSTSGAVRMSP